MAAIQPIEGRSVHHIQSGQVISDGLNSAVKELVENSLDAHATSIEVRFKNHGLDSFEVADNGDGITKDNYENIALKHYTSKLRTYEDLDSVNTFGFRGEALSSLCALSSLQVITATASEAPKGTKLEFESSGKLKSQSVVASSKGTTMIVADLYKSLPVRRRELERNIKREYSKVLGLLQAYASICVGVKFSVSNQPTKGKRTPAFATKGNPTTRENISNIFGAKSLAGLIPLDLQFEMQATQRPGIARLTQSTTENREVKIVGHISRPVVGEGRQAPDRQMFFVNGRPCVLPQIARAINEVYKTYNVTQSPFIFADIQLDTNAYDVNVSPDKRTILLHDQTEMMESLKNSLTELFEKHEQSVPQSQLGISQKTASFKQLNITQSMSSPSRRGSSPPPSEESDHASLRRSASNNSENGGDILSSSSVSNSRFSTAVSVQDIDISTHLNPTDVARRRSSSRESSRAKYALVQTSKPSLPSFKLPSMVRSNSKAAEEDNTPPTTTADEISNAVLEEDSQEGDKEPTEPILPDAPPAPQISSQIRTNYRSPRKMNETATITIGDRPAVIAGPSKPTEHISKRRKIEESQQNPSSSKAGGFVSALSRFAAPGTQVMQADEAQMEDTSPADEEPIIKSEDISEVEDAMDAMRQDANEETQGVTIPEEQPLFLSADADEDSEDAADIPPTSASPGLEHKPSENDQADPMDEEYVPEEEIRLQAKLRAARRLKEVEEQETPTQDITELLKKKFTLLEGSCRYSTSSTVKFYRTDRDQIQQSMESARNAANSVSIDQSETQALSESQTDDAAEERLSLTISKADFFKMQIKGQFNKGFILATRDDDLFIIDQHASDEKYNFETLQQTTIVQNQPLVVPRTLELMAMDEEIVINNLDILRKNGFVVQVDPEECSGKRCKLVSLPMSKETIFNVKDLEELIHLIHQNSGSSLVRCSKVRSMFAMRACRKSVMVGKALPVKAMEKIVKHMGELDKPWNCPHGRPTMRHLTTLGKITPWREYSEGGGGGGLQWGGSSWNEVLDMYNSVASGDEEQREEEEEGDEEGDEEENELEEGDEEEGEDDEL